MEIINLNFFKAVTEDENLDSYLDYKEIKEHGDLSEFKEFPDFVVVENQFYENEIIITNEHYFDNPTDDLLRTTYSEDTKLVGVWNVTYKSA